MRAEEVEENLINLQLDDYTCFEKNLDTISTWIKNQRKLKTQLLEKSNECESLRCRLDNANEEMKKLHSLCEDFLQYSDSLPINSQSQEFLDEYRLAISQNTTRSTVQLEDVTSERVSSIEGSTAGTQSDEVEILIQDMEQLLNHESRDRESLKLKLKGANEECRRLKTQFEVTKNELVKTNESLNDEKMIRSKVETERDSLACLLEKLECILLKYDRYFSSADRIVGTEYNIVTKNAETTMEIDMSSRFDSNRPIEEEPSSIDDHTSVSRESPSQPIAYGGHNHNTPRRKKKSKLFHSKTVIDKSQKQKKDLSLYCDICHRYFSTVYYLKHHKLDVHGVIAKPYKCSKCNISFAKKVRLRAHEAKHNSPKPFQRSICNQSFMHVSVLSSKARSETVNNKSTANGKDSSLSCDIRARRYPLRSSFTSHNTTQHSPVKQKPYNCTTCGKSYFYKSHFNRHREAHISRSERATKCSTREKSFRSRREKLQHERETHASFRFVCVNCEEIFYHQDNLLRHMQSHHLNLDA